MKLCLLALISLVTLSAVLGQPINSRDDRLNNLEEAVRVAPASAEAWYQLGEYYRTRFSRSRAKVAFDKAIELKPDYAEAYYGLGAWHLAPSGCGNSFSNWSKDYWVKAAELLKKAIQLKPDYG